MTKFLKNEAATLKAGEALGKRLKAGDTVLLFGELGAGKTTFTKGIAKALGIDEKILSPTFTIMNEYGGKITLRHFDCYRLKSGEEAVFAGLGELIGDGRAVSVIEWSENISDILPEKNIVSIKLRYAENGGRYLDADENIIG